jgi:hypothetical protein
MRHCLLALAVALLTTCPSFAQHDLGAREQWQPQVSDTDARLRQPVEIEVLGRAAVPALELLSEATGVSLSVAPEDLATVGERKLSIFAQGCTLKDIMVQIPEALQECHWDIDPSGSEPVYLLHRNAGVENTTKWLADRDAARRAGERRAQRVARMDEARRALKMSPEELAELEKTDILMARSVQDPHSRDLLEILLALPRDQADEFRDTGQLELDYVKAPERLQKAMHRIADWFTDRWGSENLPEELRNWQEHLSHATISFQDCGVDHGWGIWLSLNIPNEQGYPTIHDVALHPRYCNLDEGQPCYTRLLVATGAAANEDAAFEMVKQRDFEGFRVDAAKREERHKKEWIEPADPDLLQTIVLGDEAFSDFAEVQRFIARKTGLSIISDYFTVHTPYIPDDVRKGVPLWRLLYLLGEDEFRGDVYLWEKAGKCLVFHRVDWYGLARVEVPEWLIQACRAKLTEQGFLTLNDLAELAVLLDSQDLPAADFPRDFQRAGLHGGLAANSWALLLYASLSPEQLEKLRSPEGLTFTDMTISQRQRVIDRAAALPRPLTRDQAYQATFHLVQEVEEHRGRRFAKTELQLQFPDQTDRANVQFRRLKPEGESPASPKGT